MDDEELYRRTLAGDQTAITELVLRHQRGLYQFLCRHTGEPAVAEDLLQETFTRLLTYRGEPPQHFRAWAFTVARNLARDYFKSARYRREQLVDWAAEEAATMEMPLTIETGIESDGPDEVARALACLTPDQREVVILRFYHALRLEEIAAITNTPLGTVKSRLFHALKQLKGHLLRMEEVRHVRS